MALLASSWPGAMEGVDLQLRSHQTHPSSTYPHSLDRRILEGDQFREAKGRLESTIQSIERYYASPQSGSHGGPPNCDRCQKKIHDIGRAYYEYYLSNDPRCWYADSPQYKQAMQRVFDNPNGYSLDDAHFLSQSALRNHLKQDLCTAQPSDTSEINSLKYMISDVFNEGHSSTGDIINRYLHSIHHASRENPDAGSFVEALQPTTTPEERAQIYIKYYCSPSYNDTPPVKAFKSKYARIFESLAPHDEVLSAMRKEASDAQTSKVSKLRETLGELKMAQSAHLKGKKKKEEKNQRMMEREPSPRMVRCALDVCVNEVDIVGGGVVECAVCEWLEKKGGGRTVYCSVEHAEADFEEHDHHDHGCSMGNHCIHYPAAGPADKNVLPGICIDCADPPTEIMSYFCSQACYDRNLNEHREQVHMPRGCTNQHNRLELFKPSEDMEIIS